MSNLPVTEDATSPAAVAPPPISDTAITDYILARRRERAASPAPQPQQPQETRVDVDVKGDPGVMDYIKDTAYALATAPMKLTDEISDFTWGAGNYVREGFTKGFGNASFREPTPEEQQRMLRFNFAPPDTAVGKFTQNVATFLIGFGAAGVGLKAAKMLQGTSKAVAIARPAVQGAISDFVGLDAHEERLSNLIEQYPSLRNPVTALLMAKGDDSLPVGRLKGALEGVGLGLAADALIRGVRALRGLRAAKTPEEAEKILENAAADDAADAIASASRPRPGAADAAAGSKPGGVAGLSGKGGGKGEKEVAPYAPQNEFLSAPRVKEIVDKAADADTAIETITNSVNLRHFVFETPQGSHVLRDIGEAHADKLLKNAGPEKHAVILRDVANRLKDSGSDPTKLLAAARDAPKMLHELTRSMCTYYNVQQAMTARSCQLASKITMGTASNVDLAQFAMLARNIQEMDRILADAGTEAGRFFSSMNIRADGKVFTKSGESFVDRMLTPEGLTNDTARQWLMRNGWSQERIQNLARDVEMRSDDRNVAANLLKNSRPLPGMMDILREVRISGMLSSPVTWGVNAFGNALKTLTMPAERVIGGIMSADKEAVKHGMRTYVGLWQFQRESWKMFKNAFMTGRNILDQKSSVMEAPVNRISYENIRDYLLRNAPEGTRLTPMQELGAHAYGWMGNALNISSRIMISTDELFKQMNFRADLYAKLYGEAVEKEGLTKPQHIADYVEGHMRAAFEKDGAVARGELTADSLLQAQRATFTQELGADTMGGKLQAATFAHPSLSLVFPFVKSPTNILRDFLAHAPTAVLGKRFREQVRQGGAARADALGQVATGALATITAVSMALEGGITGSPPKDPKLRQALEASGWEPYSIKIGDKYYSYRRLDPLGMFLGMAADTVAVVTGKDDMADMEKDEILLGLLAAGVNNVASKTYLQGLTEAVNAYYDPGRYLQAYAGRMGATFIPLSGLLRTVRKETDPHMREMRDITDYLVNTIPVFSDNLPARHHWVTGDFVDYRYVGQDKHDMVLDELVKLGTSVMGAPLKKLHGVELSAAQYSRLCELHGTVRLQGRTLTQTLDKLFRSPGYDLGRERLADAPENFNVNPRAARVNKIIALYRRAAERKLMHEDAALARDVNIAWKSRKLSKAGAMTQDNQREVLQRLVSQ